MAAVKKAYLKSDILTSSPLGPHSWASRYQVGSVIFDASPASDDESLPATPFPSPEMSECKDSLAHHPINIFRTNTSRSGKIRDSADTAMEVFRRDPENTNLDRSVKVNNSADTPMDNRSAKMNDSRMGMALKSRTNKSVPRLVLKTPKSIVESKSAIQNADTKPSPRPRRLASRTDHPLECYNPLRIHDAEDLDIESKIRSALLSQRTRRSVLHSDSTIHKTVRWADPAIVSCGPKPKSISIAESKSTIQNGSPLKDCVKTIVSLKKHQRVKLRELLDALNKLDEDSPSIAHSEPTIEIKPRLDPRAPKFTSSVRVSNIRSENMNHCSSWATLPISRPALPPIWVRTSQPPPIIHAIPTIQNSHLDKPILPIVHPVPTIRKARLYEPIPIVHPNPTTEQDGHGREANVLDPEWAESILEKFVAKYPMTGKVKAAAPAESKGRLAAAIQQRLEYLLMETREKGAKNIAEKE